MAKQTTIKNILQNALQTLTKHSGSPRIDAEILLTHVLNQSRAYLRTWPERTLTIEQHAHFLKLLSLRTQGEPIAYLTGQRDFWDMTLTVSADTLIPRPETETLVEQALAIIPTDTPWQIADLGTGSGAIALAIARERPLCQLVATDVSAAALAVARENAARLNVSNIQFVEGSWCEALTQNHFEMIVSNPPYIHSGDSHLQQGDLRFEPLSALQSGPDGLADIRRISSEALQHLRAPGWLLLEHGYNQGTVVPDILRSLKYQQIQTVKDLSENDRVTLGAWDDSVTPTKT